MGGFGTGIIHWIGAGRFRLAPSSWMVDGSQVTQPCENRGAFDH